jgi:hypothetical protein
MAGRKKKDSGLDFIKDYLNDQEQGYTDEISFNEKIILVKQYLPITDKAVMIDTIVAGSFIEENGIKTYKPVFMEFLFDYYLAKNYTDLVLLENDYTGTYDLLKKSGLLTMIKNTIPSDELYFLEEMLDEVLNEQFHIMKREQSFTNVIKTLLDKFNSFDIEGFAEKLKGLENIEAFKDILKQNK